MVKEEILSGLGQISYFANILNIFLNSLNFKRTLCLKKKVINI